MPCSRTTLRLIAIAGAMALLSLGVPTLAAAAPVPESCDVTALAGSESGGGEDINNSGVIAGSRTKEDGPRYSEAVVWDKKGDALVLDELPGGSYGNTAHGINNAGQSVGVAVETHDHPNPWKGDHAFQHAVIWDKNGAIIAELPYLPGATEGDQAVANAINDRGTVAGWASGASYEMWGDVFDGPAHAVVWTATPGGGYTITRLGELPDTMLSEADDINNQGQVVGHALLNNLEGVAVTWDREGNATVLPVPDGATYPRATGISNKGEIVGYAELDGKTVGLIWTPVPGGGYTVSVLDEGVPDDINDAGAIIGRASLSSGHSRAVLWTPAPGGGYTITYLCPLPGHTHSDGNAINNKGQVTGRSTGPGGTVMRAARWDTR